MALSWIVKQTPPEPEGQWYSVVTDTYWTGGTWNGSYWSDFGPGLNLTATGGWASGYRPTKVRITFTGGTANQTFYLRDSNSDNITTPQVITSGQEIDITFGSFDINLLIAGWTSFDWQVSNIEFFSTTDPT